MDFKTRKAYLNSFNKSSNLAEKNEFNFKTGMLDGRRPKQAGQMKYEKNMNNYQSPRHMNTLEPLNVKKRNYIG